MIEASDFRLPSIHLRKKLVETLKSIRGEPKPKKEPPGENKEVPKTPEENNNRTLEFPQGLANLLKQQEISPIEFATNSRVWCKTPTRLIFQC